MRRRGVRTLDGNTSLLFRQTLTNLPRYHNSLRRTAAASNAADFVNMLLYVHGREVAYRGGGQGGGERGLAGVVEGS